MTYYIVGSSIPLLHPVMQACQCVKFYTYSCTFANLLLIHSTSRADLSTTIRSLDVEFQCSSFGSDFHPWPDLATLAVGIFARTILSPLWSIHFEWSWSINGGNSIKTSLFFIWLKHDIFQDSSFHVFLSYQLKCIFLMIIWRLSNVQQ